VASLHLSYWNEDLVKDVMYLPTMLPMGRGPLLSKAPQILSLISSQTDGKKKKSADQPYKNDKTKVNRQQQTLLFFL